MDHSLPAVMRNLAEGKSPLKSYPHLLGVCLPQQPHEHDSQRKREAERRCYTKNWCRLTIVLSDDAQAGMRPNMMTLTP